jgi:plastocyanin
MIRRLALLSALAVAAAAGFGHIHAAAAAGTIEGTVKGAAPGDAVVYIQKADGTFAPPAPARMDQKNLKFTPHVLPIVVGTTVKFLNSDSTQHNVFTPDYDKYNLGTWPQGQIKDHVFASCAKAPCAYVQLCRIHPEMEAYVVVLQNPYFALVDAQGHYKIDNVPPGAYSLGVWAPKGKAPAKPITVDAAKPASADFVLAK